MKEGQSVESWLASGDSKPFRDSVKSYYDAVEKKALSDLNEVEASWFMKWWKGGIIDWDNVPSKSYNSIMWACGQGCG